MIVGTTCTLTGYLVRHYFRDNKLNFIQDLYI